MKLMVLLMVEGSNIKGPLQVPKLSFSGRSRDWVATFLLVICSNMFCVQFYDGIWYIRWWEWCFKPRLLALAPRKEERRKILGNIAQGMVSHLNK
jgi:hypothetical protein